MSHFGDLMQESGRSLFLSDCQGLESVHSALRKSDIRHQCHITNAQGTKLHEEMSIRSVAFHNSRTLGFIMPPDLVPPNPEPGDDHDVNNGDAQDVTVTSQDEENNETSIEPRGFTGDHLEAETPEDLLARLEPDIVADDEEVEEELEDASKAAEVAAPKENIMQKVNMILNGGGGQIYTLQQVFEHMKNLGLRSRDLVPRDGNCFYWSILDLAQKYDIPGVRSDKHLLRLQITDAMKEHPQFLNWIQDIFEGDFELFETTAECLRQNGQLTDNMGLTTATAAHMIGKR